MNRKPLFFFAFVVITLQLFTSCSTCSRSNETFFIPDDILNDNSGLQVKDNVMKDMVDNISSPIEMASLMKTLNVPFSQKFLATTKNTSTYNTSYEKAFNLGIFGCDLGYINMYGRTSLVLEYISAMIGLANDINVGQFFDYSTMKRLATNNQNVDSLVYVSQQSFNKMDQYLRKNNRGNLSVLMVAGVWVEGMYLTCQFLKERPSEKRLAESIAEQKDILAQLLIILQNYSQERYIANIADELSSLKIIYDEIKITVEKGEPKAVETADGMLTIVQTDVCTVHYTDEQMQAIIEQFEIIRNKLIKQ